MNINPKAIRVLCFGDSHVWGYVSRTDHNRHPADVRCTGVLQKMLGSEFEVIEEGLNSRTINKEDPRPGKEGRNAANYIVPCLATHDPLDWIVFMLGTNELKQEYNMSAEQIAGAMEEFLRRISKLKSQLSDIQPQVILISPPAVYEDTEYCKQENKYLGAEEKSKRLGPLYAEVAKKFGFFSIDPVRFRITTPGPDGVHITQASHESLGKAVGRIILENS